MIQAPTTSSPNRLYYGDCLGVMERLNTESVDLIYLDPPFKSDRDYNSIYKDETGRPLPDQIQAFTDTWDYNTATEKALRQTTIKLISSGLDEECVVMWENITKGLRKFDPEMLSYIVYMAERLFEMKRLLKPEGSIYLHCDPSASHHLKIIMDIIFGKNNFRNEIIWRIGWVSGYKTKKKGWIRNHDTILYYLKSDKAKSKFNKEYIPYPEGYLRRDGKKPTGKGIPIEDTWNCSNSDTLDSIMIKSFSSEKMGYATQKPLALLERIIKASSNEGDTVLDPFCGCATTVEAAHRLKRNWIGIDIAIHAISKVSRDRLYNRLHLQENIDYVIDGIPQSLEGAIDLWKKDKFEFQKWAVEQVDGFVTTRKTGDGGIDGRIFFEEPGEKDLQSMLLEVKGGRSVNVNVLRDMRGVLEREGAKIAGLILLHKLTDRKRKNFEKEIATSGEILIEGKEYQRLQILTIEEILEGKKFEIPGYARGKISTAQKQFVLTSPQS